MTKPLHGWCSVYEMQACLERCNGVACARDERSRLPTVPEPKWVDDNGTHVLTDGETEWARVYKLQHSGQWTFQAARLWSGGYQRFESVEDAKRAVRRAFSDTFWELKSLLDWWEW